MSEEKLYQFNEYVLSYDKGHNDRSCLTISKIQNDNMYVMSSLYDGSADVINLMLNSLQEELRQTKLLKEKYQLKKDKQKELLDKIKEYLTSYESINTIQECEMPENNIGLDEETFIEMVHRYMKVHNKIIKLLEEIE